ncbi:di-heme oxidoredictase family protein [Thalassoroseus pseudoceratinae]|uniref:di-heme oxidoredictase family protein n=1 Tax=Thalassoroseus pseudoceratinae TaxID=2713176 RepID=UPI0014204FF9|nr:di-heme oxidoredictase family protein [Thalassoroseus pseudoceratinae]
MTKPSNPVVWRAVFLMAAVCGIGLAWKAGQGYTPDRQSIALGQDLFTHAWEVNDELAAEGDGLGPVYNAESCVACHFQGGVGGAGPNSKNVLTFLVAPIDRGQPVHEGVVHASAVSEECEETTALIRELFPPTPGGVTNDGMCRVRVPSVDPLTFQTINTPALFGVGELSKITDQAITWNRWKRNLSMMGQEMRGNWNMIPTGEVRTLDDGRIGKLGWKGQFADLEEFVAVACAVEMGLSNPLKQQLLPRNAASARVNITDSSAKLDLDQQQFDALVAFVESLPRPEQVLPDDPEACQIIHEGEDAFHEVGCAECHTPSIGGVDGIYSDFLIYRIEPEENEGNNGGGYGPPIPDDWPEDIPEPAEWQTPPLWGVADSAPYFHDGKSPTLHAAIERHDGAAKLSRERYRKLSPHKRSAILRFLESLRAPQVR